MILQLIKADFALRLKLLVVLWPLWIVLVIALLCVVAWKARS